MGARAHSSSKSDFLQPNYPPNALLDDRNVDLTVTAWSGNLGCATVVKALPRKARGSFNCCVLRRREIAVRFPVGWRRQQPLGAAPGGLVVVRAVGDSPFLQPQKREGRAIPPLWGCPAGSWLAADVPGASFQEDFKENSRSQESSQALEVSQPPGASVSLCIGWR